MKIRRKADVSPVPPTADVITFVGPASWSYVENELLKIAIPAGIEELSVLWRRADLPHVFKSGETRRYLERERPEIDLGEPAEQWPTLREQTLAPPVAPSVEGYPGPSVGELEAVNEQLERECRDWINLYEGALKDAGDALAALTSARETFLSIALTPSKSSCPEAHAMARTADDAANALRAFPTVRASVGELEWKTRKDRRTIARIKSGPWSVVDSPSGGCWLRLYSVSVKFCESETAAKQLANSLQRILSGAAE